MKILVLNYEYPPLGGGAGVITQHISEGLAKRGHHITVVTTWFKNTPEIEEQQNLKIIRLRSKRKYTYRSGIVEMLSWIRHSKQFLKTYCRENIFDVCLANFALPGGEVALFLKKNFRIPYVVLSHGHDIPWFFAGEMFPYHAATYFRIKNICKNATHIVLLTAEMKRNSDRFAGKGNSHKNVIIPNGCDTDFFKPDASKISTGFKIIFSGRLVNQKDPLTFIKALKTLKEKNIPFAAKIIGDGILRPLLEKLIIKYTLQDKVVVTGWISKQQMLEEYQSAHVFVQSSLYEAMSVATLEALASGTYVICTPVGANKEIITEDITGDFFIPKSSSQLAEKLAAYYNNRFTQGYRPGRETSELFRAGYDWKSILIKYENLLSSCVSQKD